MNPTQELSSILETVHNVNSTANNPEPEPEPKPNTWFDKYVLKYV